MTILLTKNIREFILEPFKIIHKIHFSECENILSEAKKMEKEAKETLEKCEKVLLLLYLIKFNSLRFNMHQHQKI